jgi:hypothetical protein
MRPSLLLCAVACVSSSSDGEQVFSSSFVFSGSSAADFVLSGGSQITANPLNSIRSGSPGSHSIASFAVPLSPGIVVQHMSFEYSYTIGFGATGQQGKGSNFTVKVAGEKVYATPLYNDYPYSHSHPNYSKPIAVNVPLSIKVPAANKARIELDFDNNDRNIQLLLPLKVNVTCTGGPCNAPPAPTPPAACTTITATATDPAMKWFCQGNGVRGCTNQHVVCAPPASTASKGLVIFLPGTYLQPKDYSEIVAEFSYHGFHALGLFYPSAEGQNGCGASRTSRPTDLNCTARERFKVLTGIPNGGRTNITQPDSIVNRAAKALAYLGPPWSHYLDSTKAVRWSDVIIAGHSNGADHAGFLSKNFNVSRALMFAGPNDNVGGRLPSGYFQAAPWVYSNWTSKATPSERLYGFGVW